MFWNFGIRCNQGVRCFVMKHRTWKTSAFLGMNGYGEIIWGDYMGGREPPGFIGAGTGLPLLVSEGIIGSALGYAVKQQD